MRGAQLRADDVVEHFFVTTTHHWLLFFTSKGRVYRAKAYQLPEAGRDARGQHVANLLAFQPDETIASVMALRDYDAAPYLMLATKSGRVKKTALVDYDTRLTGGIKAIILNDDDEVISASLIEECDDVMLVSRRGNSVRFTADAATLRPMGRVTAGVQGIRLRAGDELLAAEIVRPDTTLVTVTDAGFAKRTPVSEWRAKGRNTYGVRAMRLVSERGGLVGALICEDHDELFAIASNGVVIRTAVDEIRATGRDTMGVSLMGLPTGVEVVAVARAGESLAPDEEADDAAPGAESATTAASEDLDREGDADQPDSPPAGAR